MFAGRFGKVDTHFVHFFAPEPRGPFAGPWGGAALKETRLG